MGATARNGQLLMQLKFGAITCKDFKTVDGGSKRSRRVWNFWTLKGSSSKLLVKIVDYKTNIIYFRL